VSQTELTDTLTESDKFKDQGIVDVAPAEDKVSQMAPTPNISFEPSPVNQESRLASANIANPVGIRPTPTADPGSTGDMDMATLNRGRQVFGPNDRIFNMAQGGIMNARKPMQRVM